MAARSVRRIVGAVDIAAKHGLTPARISALYLERETNGFPEIVGHRGRARQWDEGEVDKWFDSREPSRLQQHKPPVLDPDTLLNGPQASRYCGYKNRQQVTTYRRDHPGYFPEPDVVEELGTPEKPIRREKWRVRTLDAWLATRPGSGRRAVSGRTTPSLPDVPVDGDPDELLGASQAAALLGFKSINSFSSSLAQGNLPLLKTVDALTEKGGRRRWTRRRVLEQKAAREAR
ncbi:hypothetical protein GCM10010358_81290 [Streptomyces minutiscleroticus]|uniref:Uncharacterized protein n=1 Tax=Streptomyces minutiscleroticus TaxID=68238 RepID=A0A918P387_9ACTN|nr:hypothetical protein [Streptomyces minutiscleroticus]GGY17608.1 hypothetical protein GCM10010358_81290 [Streptomyces minutiscleroticus]